MKPTARVPTFDELLARVEADPVAHLGRRSLTALNAYDIGYDVALMNYHVIDLRESIDNDAFRIWMSSRLETDEGRDRPSFSLMNCGAQLMSGTDYEAFDTYLSLWRQAKRECPNVGPEPDPPIPLIHEAIPIGVILKPVVERPAMYFGTSHSSTHELFAFCSGFLAAESDIGVPSLENRQLLQLFQKWLDRRYPFGKGRPWGHTFHFLGHGLGEIALAMFTKHMEMFLNGEDSADPGMERDIEAVLERGRPTNYRGPRQKPGPTPIKIPPNIVAKIRRGLFREDDGVLRICSNRGWLCCISPEGDCYQERDPQFKNWEWEPTIDRSRGAQLRVLVLGSERFPQLKRLIPWRTRGTIDCPDCRNGWVDYPPQRVICLTCHGLGWLEEAQGEPGERPAKPAGEVEARMTMNAGDRCRVDFIENGESYVVQIEFADFRITLTAIDCSFANRILEFVAETRDNPQYRDVHVGGGVYHSIPDKIVTLSPSFLGASVGFQKGGKYDDDYVLRVESGRGLNLAINILGGRLDAFVDRLRDVADLFGGPEA